MKLETIKAGIAVLVLMAGLNLQAQTIMPDSMAKNKLYIEAGIDPASIITLGYQRQFNKAIVHRNLFYRTEISTSMFYPGSNNSALKTGATIPLVETGKFKIANSINLSMGNVKTSNFSSMNFAFGDKIALGLYSSKSFVALITEYEHICLNRIKHTEYYRKTYYEGAKDGWYKGGGGAFQFGFETGVCIAKKFDSRIEIKVPFTEKFNGYGGSPFNVRLGIAYRY